MERVPEAFARGRKGAAPEADFEKEKDVLYRKIGQLEVERDWLKIPRLRD